MLNIYLFFCLLYTLFFSGISQIGFLGKNYFDRKYTVVDILNRIISNCLKVLINHPFLRMITNPVASHWTTYHCTKIGTVLELEKQKKGYPQAM